MQDIPPRRPQEGANLIDRTGRRYGKLVVIRRAGSRPQTGARAGSSRPRSPRVEWLCICDCGNEKVMTADVLRYATSCGCARREPRPNYRRKNPLPPGQGARNVVLKHYKRNCARDRGLCWELSGEEFDNLTAQDCAYCGCPPSTVHRTGRSSGEFVYNGLDRVDNTLGYVPGNVVACCATCNHAKSDMPYEQFMAWLARLVMFHGKHLAAA